MTTPRPPFAVHFQRRTIAVLLAAAALLVGSTVFGALANNGSSKILFKASQSDVSVDGEFRKFTADVDFDPARPAAGRVNLVVDVGSVSMGSADADALLKGKDFFDVAHFPQATFASQAISTTNAGHFQARGQFTLKGRSTGLTIPFSVRPEGAGLRIEGSVPVSRLAYKVGEGEWADTGTLADQVSIRFNLYVPR